MIDTNVIVDHFQATDSDASAAVVTVKKRAYAVLVCPKLLMEYRDILSSGTLQLRPFADRYLMMLFPKFKQCPEPDVQIDFGPRHDRFHMQLALDHKADFHVSKDGEVLSVTAEMFAAGGVKVRHPRDFVVESGNS